MHPLVMYSLARSQIARADIELEIVTPETLALPARNALIDELYAVHDLIFSGVSREAFAAYVVVPDAASTRIQVARVGGRVVGYFALHVFERELDERHHAIVRIESGYEPAVRGLTIAAPFLLVELVRLCMRYPAWPKHYLGCHVHPSAYIAWSRLMPVWPRPGRPTDPDRRHLMDTLARSFGLSPHSSAHGTWKVGWITREDPRTAASWTHHPSSAARFYVANNPSFAQGHGLLVYSRISWPTVVGAMVASARRALRRRPRLAHRDSANVSPPSCTPGT